MDKNAYANTVEDIIECAQNWISDDADSERADLPDNWQWAITYMKAAPDLLAELKNALGHMLDAYNALTDLGEHASGDALHIGIEAARAAITKAKGE